MPLPCSTSSQVGTRGHFPPALGGGPVLVCLLPTPGFSTEVPQPRKPSVPSTRGLVTLLRATGAKLLRPPFPHAWPNWAEPGPTQGSWAVPAWRQLPSPPAAAGVTPRVSPRALARFPVVQKTSPPPQTPPPSVPLPCTRGRRPRRGGLCLHPTDKEREFNRLAEAQG